MLDRVVEHFDTKVLLDETHGLRQHLVGVVAGRAYNRNSKNRALPEIGVINLCDGNRKTVVDAVLETLQYLSFVFQGAAIGEIQIQFASHYDHARSPPAPGPYSVRAVSTTSRASIVSFS